MQTLASEFKRTREPKIQKFRGGTSSGALLVFKSWMQDIDCAIKDGNLNNDEAVYSKTYDRFFRQEKTVNRCWPNSIVAYKIQKNRLKNSESQYCK